MSSTANPSASSTPSNCKYGFCGNQCLETSSSICCTGGGGSGNSSGVVQCGNGWACSLTSGYCCPKLNQEYCSGAEHCINAGAGESCCGPTWCPGNQTCANSGDRCCPNTQTVCATDWWLVPTSTSTTVVSMTTTPTASPTTESTSLKSSTTSVASKSGTPTSSPSTTTLSTGAKAGISVGAVIGAIAIIGLILLLLRKWRNRSRPRGRGPMYIPTGTSEYEPATYEYAAPARETFPSGYGSERRDNIPLVATTPPQDYGEMPAVHPSPRYDEPDESMFAGMRAPAFATVPRE